MVSDADIAHVEASLRRLDFLVVQDIFLTETAKLAHVVLPAACFAEVDGTFTNTERKVQRCARRSSRPGQPAPTGRSSRDLAGRLGHPMAYAGAEAIMARDRAGHALLLRDHLPAAGARGDPLALHRHRPPGHALPAPGQVHLRAGRLLGGRVPAAGGVAGRGVPADADDRAGALPVPHRHDDHEDRRGSTSGRRRASSRSPARTRARSAIADGDLVLVELAPRRDHRPGARLRDDRARHGLHAVPLGRGRGEPADLRRRARPGLEDPGVQGLRGPHRARWSRRLETMTAAGEERA